MENEKFHENDRINEILRDLFYNRLNLEVSMKEWVKKLPSKNFIPIWIDEEKKEN